MSAPRSPLHLAVTLDVRRLPHAAAMLHSVFAHTRGGTIHVHVLREPDFTAASLQQFAAYIESLGGVFHDHPASEADLAPLPMHDYFPRVDWLRLFAPRIEAERLLLLDAELIVREDLSELAALPLDGHLIAAVPEGMWFNSTLYGVHTHLAAMGLKGADYFNTGLLLMDLAALRQENTTEALLAYARDPQQPKRLAVQDAFNAVLRHRWKRLPMKWGAHKIVTMNHALEVPVEAGELEVARYRPAAVHFCSPDKPWFPNSRHPFRPEYIRHRKRTPWAEGLYRQMDAQTFWYFLLPTALRVYLYGWVPPQEGPGLWHYRYKFSPRYLGGALLQRLPAGFANRIRRLAGRPAKD